VSAAATQAPVHGFVNTRRVPRFPLTVPADVTVLRSGNSHSIPARSVTLSEHGLGLVLAGEVHPGDSINLDFYLPDFGGRLQLKAIVRYQALLQCGLGFESITPQQQRLIEHWTRTKSVTNPTPATPVARSQSLAPHATPATSSTIAVLGRKNHHARFRRALGVLLAGLLVTGGVYGWHWQRAWNDLESQIPATKPRSTRAPAYVSAEVMERLLTHKVDPIYPEDARRAKVQGVVILDATIGPDGSVVDLHAISGPEVLRRAALDAVKWWRFQPYRANGQAVEAETSLVVDFRAN
jgi:TonB family protein